MIPARATGPSRPPPCDQRQDVAGGQGGVDERMALKRRRAGCRSRTPCRRSGTGRALRRWRTRTARAGRWRPSQRGTRSPRGARASRVAVHEQDQHEAGQHEGVDRAGEPGPAAGAIRQSRHAADGQAARSAGRRSAAAPPGSPGCRRAAASSRAGAQRGRSPDGPLAAAEPRDAVVVDAQHPEQAARDPDEVISASSTSAKDSARQREPRAAAGTGGPGGRACGAVRAAPGCPPHARRGRRSRASPRSAAPAPPRCRRGPGDRAGGWRRCTRPAAAWSAAAAERAEP